MPPGHILSLAGADNCPSNPLLTTPLTHVPVGISAYLVYLGGGFTVKLPPRPVLVNLNCAVVKYNHCLSSSVSIPTVGVLGTWGNINEVFTQSLSRCMPVPLMAKCGAEFAIKYFPVIN